MWSMLSDDARAGTIANERVPETKANALSPAQSGAKGAPLSTDMRTPAANPIVEYPISIGRVSTKAR